MPKLIPERSGGRSLNADPQGGFLGHTRVRGALLKSHTEGRTR